MTLDIIDHIIICSAFAVAFGLSLCALGGIAKAIDHFTEGKFSEAVVNFFKED